jgi:hypothetical protein
MRAWRRTLCLVLTLAGAPGLAAAAGPPEDLPSVPVGTQMTYACSGIEDSRSVQTMQGKQGGNHALSFRSGGVSGYQIVPGNLWGAFLRRERVIGERTETMRWNPAATAEFDPREPGAGLAVNAEMRGTNPDYRAELAVRLRVAGKETLESPVLGRVETVRIAQQQTMTEVNGAWKVSSKAESWYDLETGMPVRSVYTGPKGSLTCHLSEVVWPN